MVVRLYQSKWEPYRSTFRNDHDQVLYKVETPKTLRHQVSTIYRVVPNEKVSSHHIHPTFSESPIVSMPLPAVNYDGEQEVAEVETLREGSKKTLDSYLDNQDEENGDWGDHYSEKSHLKAGLETDSASEVVDMEDHFEVIAKIEWGRVASSSVLDWGLTKQQTSEFFTKSGFYAFGSGKKWTGPNGRSYVWQMRLSVPVLVLDDGSKDPPVVAAFHRAPFFHPFDKEWLEIYPEGEKIIDAILITYVYVERVRKNRENAARWSGGAG